MSEKIIGGVVVSDSPELPRAIVDDSLLKLRIVWGAFCLIIFFHGYLLMNILGLGLAGSEPLPELVGGLTRPPGVIFSGVAVLLLYLSRIVPGFLFRSHLKKTGGEQKNEKTKNEETKKEETKNEENQGKPQSREYILASYWISYLVGLLMLEGIGFIGFLWAAVSNDLRVFMLFGLISLLNMLIRFPRKTELMGQAWEIESVEAKEG